MGGLQLLLAVETRFASQIYSCERILADMVVLQQMWYGPQLREFVTRSKNSLKLEYHYLTENVIMSQAFWDRIRFFVSVEIPIRTLLRISDGHSPNLSEIAYGFEHARTLSLAASAAAEVKFPQHYERLQEQVDAKFIKRETDIAW